MSDFNAVTSDPGQDVLDEKYAALRAQYGEEFFQYDPNKSPDTIYTPDLNEANPEVGVAELRDHYLQALNTLRRGDSLNKIFPPDFTNHFTAEEVARLETEGLVVSGINDKHPKGGVFVKNHLESSLGHLDQTPNGIRKHISEEVKAILVTGVLRGITGLITRPPIDKIPETLQGLKRFPMNTTVAAVYGGQGKEQSNEWSQTYVHPDGVWMLEGYDTSALQYGQGCFEGMVASRDGEPVPLSVDEAEVEIVDGKVTLFRPEENAKRFIKSCERLGLPPVSVNQYMEAVIAAVKNNKEFIPANGKLYIRPYMIGLRGGTGIQPASQCLFGVEVSPFGAYIPASAEGVDVERELPGAGLKAVTFNRATHGTDKASANYAVLIEEKEHAKAESDVEPKPPYAMKDVLLITDEGLIQEGASNNFFLIDRSKSDTEMTFTFNTSSLMSNILAGITRKSVIELLRDPKIQARLLTGLAIPDGIQANIDVKDDVIMHEDKLKTAKGAYGTGTAVGISNFKMVRARDGEDVVYNDPLTQHLIKNLYDLLQDLRRGKVEGYKHWVLEV